jgi:hypothetical protein
MRTIRIGIIPVIGIAVVARTCLPDRRACKTIRTVV